MIGRLRQILRPEGDRSEATGGLSRLRFWAAGGMVVVSVLSALAVLKASVYDETGSQKDALYRQQLVAREGTSRTREEQVAQDLALFGNYEQHVARAQGLRHAADVTADPRLVHALRSRAERELAISAALYHDFQVVYPTTGKRGGLSYDPSTAYAITNGSALALHDDVNPAPHRLEGRSARHDGVGMAGVAALLLGALVLFTLAQVYAANKSVKSLSSKSEERERSPPQPAVAGAAPQTPAAPPAAAVNALPPVQPAVLRLAYLLFGSATVVTIVGIVLGVGIVG